MKIIIEADEKNKAPVTVVITKHKSGGFGINGDEVTLKPGESTCYIGDPSDAYFVAKAECLVTMTVEHKHTVRPLNCADGPLPINLDGRPHLGFGYDFLANKP